jgi:hypothetical protein
LLFPPHFSDKDRFTSTRPDIVLVTPISAKTRNNKILQGGGFFGVVGAAEGVWEAAPQQHRQPPAEPPTPGRKHRPKDLSKPRRDIHLVEIKYCEDTRPQNQLFAATEQQKDLLCNILQGASVTLHIILLGVDGTIYNVHTLKPFKELVLILKELRSLPPTSMCTL